ncbi:MAG: YajQ family cyclic di-GMP-binding protein [Armatimonadetes bacterium]|nr:YajQ family cyclic di-GMP-binding protein [Armatimonadota bacterium]
MADYSFDVVSKVDMQEVKNALDQAEREIGTRYDFKNTNCSMELDGEKIELHADDEYRMTALIEVVQSKLIKRGVDLKSFDYGAPEPASKGTVRQTLSVKQGIPTDDAKKISKRIKEEGFKAQAQIQGDQLRVSSKSKDDLQKVIQFLKTNDFDIPLQFVNYR